jgi:hypothetical protein
MREETMTTTKLGEPCERCGELGATVTVYFAGGCMSHYHPECRPEKEHSACAERHQWSIEQWLRAE